MSDAVQGMTEAMMSLEVAEAIAAGIGEQNSANPFTRERSEDYPEGPSVAVTGFHAGAGPASETTIPDTTEFVVTVRALPTQTTSEVLAQIQQLVATATAELLADEACRGIAPRAQGIPPIELRTTPPFEPVSVPAGNPYVQALCRAVRPYHPSDAQLLRVQHGAGDLSFINGIPGVEFGPRGAGVHQQRTARHQQPRPVHASAAHPPPAPRSHRTLTESQAV